MPYLGKTPSQATRQRYYLTASGGETSISGTMTTGGTLTFNDGEFVDVKLNGVSLVAGTDYNTSTANTIAGLSALAANDQVEIVVYDTFSVFSGDVDSNLSVGGNLSVTGTSTFNSDVDLQGSAGATLKLTSTDTTGADTELLGQIDFVSSDSSTGSAGTQARIKGVYEDNGDSTGIAFLAGASTGSGTPTISEVMRIRHEGKVAIGTSTAVGTLTTQCTAGDSNSALTAYHPTSTSARTIAKFQSNVGSTQADVLTIACDGDVTTSGGVSATGEITSTGSSLSQNSNSIRTAIGNDGGSGSMGTSTNHALNIASNNTTRLQLTNDGVLGNFNGRNSVGIITSKTSITVDDDASVTIIDASSSQIAGRGMLLIYETSGGSGGTFTAGFGSATLLNTTNNFGTGADFVVGDTDNNFCVIVSGHELTFKNRIGSERTFHIQFIGAGIT